MRKIDKTKQKILTSPKWMSSAFDIIQMQSLISNPIEE